MSSKLTEFKTIETQRDSLLISFKDSEELKEKYKQIHSEYNTVKLKYKKLSS